MLWGKDPCVGNGGLTLTRGRQVRVLQDIGSLSAIKQAYAFQKLCMLDAPLVGVGSISRYRDGIFTDVREITAASEVLTLVTPLTFVRSRRPAVSPSFLCSATCNNCVRSLLAASCATFASVTCHDADASRDDPDVTAKCDIVSH